MENWEIYEWKTNEGKKLRVKFRRIIDKEENSWMERYYCATVCSFRFVAGGLVTE